MFRTFLIYLRMYKYMLRHKKHLGKDRKRDIEEYAFISRRSIEIAKYSVEVIGMENVPKYDGVLYTPNHQSFFDVFTIVAVLKKQLSFIGKKQFKHFFNVGLYIEKMDGILIDRDDVKSQVMLIRELTNKLKSGLNVVVFPEGTRSKDGLLNEFKGGSYKMALKSKCDIVPVTYYNNHEVVKNGKDRVIKMKIDKPITYEEYKGLKTSEIASMIQTIIQNNLDKGFNSDEAQRVI